MDKKHFGTLPTGEEIYLYTINDKNITAEITNFGAALVKLIPFGADVIGGFENLSDYLEDTAHHGGTIGRVANRIKNARFTMDGREYSVTVNDGPNCLHGGVGFDRRVWNVTEHTENSITLAYTSEDGEEGFPARLAVWAKYTLLDGAVIIDYTAKPSGKTPIAMTNHSYFNLDGFENDIKNHKAKIYASCYTEVDKTLIPTGIRPQVAGSVHDFTEERKIGERICGDFSGYDHSYFLSPTVFTDYMGKKLGLAAEFSGRKIKMTVYTDQPCAQFYTGNFLKPKPAFKYGIKPDRHLAFCFETQTEPNCINSNIGFYSENDTYTHTVIYKFDRS
jgi:aldose 1-epimerase